jgi:hypothetical protein
MIKKNIKKAIKHTLGGLLTMGAVGMIGMIGYPLITSRIKLEPNQGAIVRELKNVNNELYNAPRGIINDTNKTKRFWKQPYIPGLEIGSVEEYFDLDKTRKIDGTFAFWSKDKVTLKRDDIKDVRAFNFECDVDVINLDSWIRWDPVRAYGRNFAASEIESREEALSQLIEETFLSGIKDYNGNYELNEKGLPKFLGLSPQTSVWYSQLVTRHDFLIDKLQENELLEKLNDLDEDGKKEIKEFYNNFFEENPWYVLGPLRLEAEGQGVLRNLESYYFSQYPWWTKPMFYNNYSGETKQKVMGSLYGINPPKDMMADEENLREIPEIESRLYRDYSQLTKLSQKISDVIKYDTEINATKVIRGVIDNKRKELEEFKNSLTQQYQDFTNLIEKEMVQQTFSPNSLEALRILNNEKGEEELENKITSIVNNYTNAQLQIAHMALIAEGTKELINFHKKSSSDLELLIKEEGKTMSNEIINDYNDYVIAQTSGLFNMEDLSFSALQQSWEAFIPSISYQFADANILNHAVSHILLSRQEKLSNSIEESMSDFDNQKMAQWLYKNISKDLQEQNIELKSINEFNITAITDEHVSDYNDSNALEYVSEKLNIGVHEYTITQDLMKAERMREKELIPFFDEYLIDTREKEMRLWDYALEEILSGNGGLEKYDKSEEKEMDEVRKIRDSYAYKFIEQEAPKYFKEFMEYSNDLPFTDSLGIVIKNYSLSVEDEPLTPMGTVNDQYRNVLKMVEKGYRSTEDSE